MVEQGDRGHGSRQGRGEIRIAIIGTGLAGLHAAHLLSETSELRRWYDVHLFEKGDQIGLDGSSITVDGNRIDVPMRSFNAGYYPQLMKLYRSLGIPVVRNNFSFSFSNASQPRMPFLLYNGRSGLSGVSFPKQASSSTANAASVSPARLLQYSYLILVLAYSYICLVALSLYHLIPGHLHNSQHPLSSTSLEAWLSQHQRSIRPLFVDTALLPLFSAMTTSTLEQVKRMPASEVLLYIAATFLRNHYSVSGGVSQVQNELIKHIPKERIHTDIAIEEVSAQSPHKNKQYRITLQGRHGKAQELVKYMDFDHIIFATPANLSAMLLDTYASSLEAESSTAADTIRSDHVRQLQKCLEQVIYTPSTVVNHSDSSLTPHHQGNWRDLNLVSPIGSPFSKTGTKSKVEVIDRAMATHICHRQANGDYVFQTTNPTIPPRPSTVIASATFSRALTSRKSHLTGLYSWERRKRGLLGWEMTLGSLQKTQESWKESPGLWFCGSYAQGIPLLEGCVTSSALVVNEIMQQQAAQCN